MRVVVHARQRIVHERANVALTQAEEPRTKASGSIWVLREGHTSVVRFAERQHPLVEMAERGDGHELVAARGLWRHRRRVRLVCRLQDVGFVADEPALSTQVLLVWAPWVMEELLHCAVQDVHGIMRFATQEAVKHHLRFQVAVDDGWSTVREVLEAHAPHGINCVSTRRHRHPHTCARARTHAHLIIIILTILIRQIIIRITILITITIQQSIILIITIILIVIITIILIVIILITIIITIIITITIISSSSP